MKYSMFKKLIAYISAIAVAGGILLIAIPAFAQVQVGGREYDHLNAIASDALSLGVTASGSTTASGNATATTNVNGAATANSNTRVVVTDANIKEVSTSSQSVSMSYPTHAKLFGFIPMIVTARAEIESNGVVHVQYPWYSIFMSTDGTALQARLQAAANAVLLVGTTSVATQDKATLTANDQITLIKELHAVLQNNFSGSLQSSTTGA